MPRYASVFPPWVVLQLCLLPTVLHCLSCESLAVDAIRPPNKTRVIVTTDGEIDDRCSMVRFLLYANEWDLRGLIHSSSKYHWKGNAETAAHDWPDMVWLDRQLDAYEQVYAQLRKHDSTYPSPDDLRHLVFVGNIEAEGDMRAATPVPTVLFKCFLSPTRPPFGYKLGADPTRSPAP